jgi:hypothetical protein
MKIFSLFSITESWQAQSFFSNLLKTIIHTKPTITTPFVAFVRNTNGHERYSKQVSNQQTRQKYPINQFNKSSQKYHVIHCDARWNLFCLSILCQMA